MAVSKTQIDWLGERLKEAAEPTEADLRMLDEYRRSFGGAYDIVVKQLRELGLQPTGRPAKSTKSIVDKLRRESVRLSQIQDLAGCRVLVADLTSQDRVVTETATAISNIAIVDRRRKPSHNYRAVHLIARHADATVEIQVRTNLQHLWAEVSEKLSDKIEIAIKYGGGDAKIQGALTKSSTAIARIEELKKTLSVLPAAVTQIWEVTDVAVTLARLEADLEDRLRAIIVEATNAK